MEKKGLTDSPEYQIVLENIEQAKHYYKTHDQTIREKYMAANFIREVDSLPENEKIMGVYGSAHVNHVFDITGWDDYNYWKIWRIEKPDETLKNLKPKKAYNYYSNYPTPVSEGDVFRIELTKIDGTKRAEYFRADGKVYDGEKSTNLILQE